MTDKLVHDSGEMCRKGADQGAASTESYRRAEGDPPWEADIEEMFGKAAHYFNLGIKRYLKDSSAAYTEVGDKRVAVENQAYSSAMELDNADVEGAGSVRRAKRMLDV
ncbi:hypothetical protein [Nocardia pneumoniae]|uniref:hypothetical protein n=1 Tax=Nocardia pneumoniae TaxID=228601 RepID=UPI0002E6191D|nr:hypothetical protein [Nocardia pneumoniae]